jgi:DNA-binding CsgD family transcriptional regulator
MRSAEASRNYSVECESDAGGPAPAGLHALSHLPTGAGLIFERDSALEAVVDGLDAARQGIGRAILLVGPAGIGKTTVLTAAKGDAKDKGFTVGSATGSPMETGIPFGAVGQAIATLAAASDASASATPIDPPLAGPASLFGYYRWLTQRATRAPLLLAFDDLHWADPDSLQLIGFLCRRLIGSPILVVGTLRPEPDHASALAADLTRSDHARVVRLEPLSHEASGRLIAQAAGFPVDAAQSDRLWRTCAGTPLLLRGAAETLAGRGLMSGSPEHGAFERRELLERFAGGGGDAFSYVQAASILGVQFQPAIAGMLAGLDDASAHAAHVGLVRAGLLADLGDRRSTFVHPLFAQALLEFQPASVRERRHAEAFRRLVEQGAPDAVAAEHAAAARLVGDRLAIEVTARAGRHALARGALEGACRHLATAIKLAGEEASADLLLNYARAATAHGQINQARGVCERLLDREDIEQITRVRTLGLLARASSLVAARPAESRHLYEQAADAATRCEAATRGHVLADAALSCHVFSPTAWTERMASGSLRTLSDDDPARPRMELLLAYTQLLEGNRSAERLVRGHLNALLRGMHTHERGWEWAVVTTMLNACKYLEDPDSATGLFDRAFARALDVGSPLLINALAITYSEVLLAMGRPQEALELVQRAAGITDSPLSPWRDLALAVYLTELGRDQDAGPHLDALRALRARVHEDFYAPVSLWLAVLHGRRMILAGQTEQASDTMLHAAGIAEVTGWRHPLIVPWASAAIDAHLAAGRLDRAGEVIAELERVSQSLSIRWPQALVLLSRARLAGAAGNTEEADQRFDPALAAVAQLPFPIYQAEALLAYGSYLRRSGRPREARAPLGRALGLCEQCGAERVARLVRAELAASGARRRRRNAASDELTAQEQRVAGLAADGLTNPQIAAALCLSPKTIGHYLERIYSKLGIRSRHELVMRRGDLPPTPTKTGANSPP